jgi:endo-1,4-beta-xylanase
MKKNLRFTLLFMIFLASMLTVNAQQKLRDAAAQRGKYIGTIANNNFFLNPSRNEVSYEPILKAEYNALVAEENYKLQFIIPNKPADPFNIKISEINTAALDRLVNFGVANDMLLRGHALVWHTQTPTWLEADAVNWTNNQVYAFTESYIKLVVGYTKGKIKEWDVFNELLTDGNGATYRTTGVWYKNVTNKQDYLDKCFQWARAADPSATLFYNDYSIERYSNTVNSKNRVMLRMVQDMKNRGIPIDAVGLQGHFESGTITTTMLNEMSRTMDTVINMGLICNITELDLRICSGTTTPLVTPSAAQLATQKEDYKSIVRMALSKRGSTGLTMWGFTDKHTWFQWGIFFQGCDHSVLYDKSYNPKPAYQGVLEGLLGLPVNTSDLSTNKLIVYPNPSASGIFRLSENKSFQVFTQFGQLLFEKSGTVVDLSSCPRGLYILKTGGLSYKLINLY